MFFAPDDYLQRDPAETGSEREAARLRREADQRAKLCEATTRLAARGGMEAATIQQAARSAAVGQGTYYKLYGTREACLQEAFERCADKVLARVEDAAARMGDDLSDRLEAGLGELLALLDGHPDVARLLLVEVLAGDDRCREARERWLGRLARLFANGHGAADVPRRGSLAWLAAAALASVLALRLENGGAESEGEMLGELVGVGTWPQRGAAVEAARRAERAADEEELEPVEVKQKKREATQRARASKAQRERIVAAMGRLAGAKGYRATRMAELLAKADISAPLFCTHFRSKEECLLEAFDVELAAIEEQVVAAVRNAEGCAQRAESGLGALLEALAAGPWRARLVTVEIKAAGERGEQRYEEALLSFVTLIGDGASDDVAQMTAGTIGGAIAREVGGGRAVELEGLLPELLFAALAPYLGGEEAAERARAASETST